MAISELPVTTGAELKPRQLFLITGVAAALLLSLDISSAYADEIEKEGRTCGSTTKSAIAAAEKLLITNEPESQKQALLCIVTALKKLEAAQPIAKRGDDQHEMLHAPELPGGPGLSGRSAKAKK